ncbi:hypothetical protein TRICI_000921 [Trichomonascus ciferrii]|uniref:Septin-type G domain-containing protein n=1 Tax=Trichomonascus ciferrii TaxID=44093 RepID=A0A642VCX1_9ASCO|nr:hypothetical protein TRICI_000921 [Trichomonascus ciferrii]
MDGGTYTGEFTGYAAAAAVAMGGTVESADSSASSGRSSEHTKNESVGADSQSAESVSSGQSKAKYEVEVEHKEDHHQLQKQDEVVKETMKLKRKDEYKPDLLISKLPDQRRDIVAKRGSAFTLMVAGESGLGKSTFINTLFGDKFRDPDRPRQTLTSQQQEQQQQQQQHQLSSEESSGSEGGRKSPSKTNGAVPCLDMYEKTTRIEIQEAVYEEKGFKAHFTVIDTPGFGDYTNNKNSWVPIVNYIDEQHRIYMLREEQPDRRRLVDTRVHACLYFIRPSGHGLHQLDIKAMQELSTRVNLIPIIAKADSFSVEDRDHFKRAVRRDIDSNNIKVYCPPGEASMPFAIISSEQMVEVRKGKFVRGRQYRWGVAEVDNEAHCDFVKLRRLLMTEHMLNLIDTTIENHYESYRRKTMLHRIAHHNGQPTTTTQLNENDNGLDILKAIHIYGREFLQNGLLEHDPIFTEKKNRTSERFDIIVSFQEKKFEQWRTELKAKQDEYNSELEQLHSEIIKLQADVDMLEFQSNNHHNPISIAQNPQIQQNHHHHHHRDDQLDNVNSIPSKPSRSTKYTIRG